MPSPQAFDYKHYVPCLRWKAGEYRALHRLHLFTTWKITPLIEIAEIGWDFETESEAKTIDEHLVHFAKRLQKEWGKWAFIDLKQIPLSMRMQNGKHPLNFVFDDMKVKGAYGIPVTSLNRDAAFQAAVLKIVTNEGNGICLRVSINEIVEPTFSKSVANLLKILKLHPEKVDFIFDLETPSNFNPIEGFSQMVKALTARIPNLNAWRSFTICGTSFPESMGEFDLGVEIKTRDEWLFYKQFLKNLKNNDRKPTFGDYAVANPRLHTLT